MVNLKNIWETCKKWLERKIEFILNTRFLAILLIIIIYLAPTLLRPVFDSLESRLKDNRSVSIEESVEEEE
ncbi:MAG: hypothetical protein J6J86_07240 [Lachnospiraceae bacterium]|nr:hypothetical protein [Lachnospiraceae bacterium]